MTMKLSNYYPNLLPAYYIYATRVSSIYLREHKTSNLSYDSRSQSDIGYERHCWVRLGGCLRCVLFTLSCVHILRICGDGQMTKRGAGLMNMIGFMAEARHDPCQAELQDFSLAASDHWLISQFLSAFSFSSEQTFHPPSRTLRLLR